MDLTPLTTSHGTVKSPEPDSETPTRIQPIKPFPFTNGVLKRHHHHSTPPPPPPLHPVSVIYKECLKNHAASLGGHALDGCGEFMPSPTSTPTDPTSFKCAACGCHRNFHRREPEEPISTTTTTTHVIEYQPHHRHHPPPPPLALAPANRSPSSASPPPISSSYYPSAPHMLLALSGGGLTPAMPENVAGGVVLPYSMVTPSPNSRKRFRTKFTQDQKDKMCEFAEKVGWKMQKRDEEMVKEFCSDIGIDKGVLKVWMHNNKNTFGKKDGIGIGRNTLDEHIHNDDDDDDDDKMNNGNDGGGGGGGDGGVDGDGDGHAAGTNGSSSSS